MTTSSNDQSGTPQEPSPPTPDVIGSLLNPKPVVVGAPTGDIEFLLYEENYNFRSERSCFVFKITNNGNSNINISRISFAENTQITLITGPDSRISALKEKSARIREHLSSYFVSAIHGDSQPSDDPEITKNFITKAQRRAIKEFITNIFGQSRIRKVGELIALMLSRRLVNKIENYIKTRGAFPIIANFNEAVTLRDALSGNASLAKNETIINLQMSQLEGIQSEIDKTRGKITISPGKNLQVYYVVEMDRSILNELALPFTLECSYYLDDLKALKQDSERENRPREGEEAVHDDGQTEEGERHDVAPGEEMLARQPDQDHEAIPEREYYTANICAFMTVTPSPWMMNTLAILFSLIGTAVTFYRDWSLFGSFSSNPYHAESLVRHAFLSATHFLTSMQTIAAVVTGMILFNIYEKTPLWYKLRLGINWRSAMIVGFFSGMMSKQILAWFQRVFTFT